jgi:hypothetical protein
MKPMSRPMRCFSLVSFYVLLSNCTLVFAQEQQTGAVIGVEETATSTAPVGNPERLFRDVKVGARTQPKVGGVEGSLETQFGGPLLTIPLLNQAIRPEDAEIKLGRFYLDVRSVSGSLLYSDNIDLSGTERRDGLIGIARLRLATMFQLTDDLRLTLAGTLVYLPFRGDVGVAGFGIQDALAEFENSTLAKAQITYDLNLGEWRTELFDDFRVRLGRFGEDYELFEGETFDEEDRAGRYVFQDRTSTPGRNSRLGNSFLETRNIVGFSTDRLLPTETRLEFGANHANYWYEGDRGGFLPSTRDLGYVSLSSERESLRFKPFANYKAFRYSNNPFDQEANIGVQGPITEYVEVLGEVGYFHSGRSDRDAFICRARIGHAINSRTYHQLNYWRRVTQPDEDLEQSWSYRLSRSLASSVYGELYFIKSRFDDLDGNRSGSDEWRTGIRLNFLSIAPETSLRLSGTYARIDYDADIFTDRERWTAQAEIHYRSLEWRLLYHHQNTSTSPTRDGFDENMVALTMIKYF